MSYDKNQQNIIAITSHGSILRYSLRENKWEEYSTESKLQKATSPSNFRTAINAEANQILCMTGGDNASLISLKLNKDKSKPTMSVMVESSYGTGGSSAILIEDQLHIIGGWVNKSHLRWNNETKQFDVLHKNVMDIKRGIFINVSTLLKVGNRVLSFGGYHDRQFLDCMMEYDIIKNAWKRLKITMPRTMTSFGCVSVMNEKYILLFGGEDGVYNYNHKKFDDVYIYSVGDRTFTKSGIKCPKAGAEFNAVTVNDKEKEELAVYGYIRYQWRTSQINEQLFPPRYLIQIMRRYYHVEYVHLFHSEVGVLDRDNTDWKIDIFDVL